jgi:hypothetical protein
MVQQGETLAVASWAVSLGGKCEFPAGATMSGYGRTNLQYTGDSDRSFRTGPSSHAPDSCAAMKNTSLNLRAGIARGGLGMRFLWRVRVRLDDQRVIGLIVLSGKPTTRTGSGAYARSAGLARASRSVFPCVQSRRRAGPGAHSPARIHDLPADAAVTKSRRHQCDL